MAEPATVTPPEQKPIDEKAIRSSALKAHRDACDRIRKHVAALKPEAWRKAGQIVAEKFFALDEPEWETFRSECNDAIARAMETQSLDSGIEVIGEREFITHGGKRSLTPAQQFTRAEGFKKFVEGGGKGGFRTELTGSYISRSLATRDGFNSSDLAAVNVTISQSLISQPVRRLMIQDLIMPGTMSTEGFIYPLETAFDDEDAEDAREVGERELKPEWEPRLTTARADASVIAVMGTIPKQFLQDFSAFASWLDNRLEFRLNLRLEKQLLYGTGIAPNILGIFNREGIQRRTLGDVVNETTADATYRGITDIEFGYFQVDGFAMHPYDWEQVRLLKDLNGQYLGGGPFYAPYGNGTIVKFSTLWGVPCVVSRSVKQGKPLCGAWKMAAQFFTRQGVQIETTNSHNDYFRRNLLAVLAEERGALAVYYPPAFLEHQGFPGRA